MAYKKGLITIPNVTGNIEIIVTTAEAEIYPIELYTGNASDYQLNKKYSGNSIVDGNGYYLSDILSIDEVRPYFNVDGVTNGIAAKFPVLYKIGLCKGANINSVVYWSNLCTDKNATQYSYDLSGYMESGIDGIQLLFQLGSSAITSIPSTDEISIKLSATPLY